MYAIYCVIRAAANGLTLARWQRRRRCRRSSGASRRRRRHAAARQHLVIIGSDDQAGRWHKSRGNEPAGNLECRDPDEVGVGPDLAAFSIRPPGVQKLRALRRSLFYLRQIQYDPPGGRPRAVGWIKMNEVNFSYRNVT